MKQKQINNANKIKELSISNDFVNHLLKYLQSRPYVEVFRIINELLSLKEVSKKPEVITKQKTIRSHKQKEDLC